MADTGVTMEDITVDITGDMVTDTTIKCELDLQEEQSEQPNSF